MKYQDLWPVIQKDILGCLLADELIGTRQGVAVEPGDVEDALNRKVQKATGIGRDNHIGVGFLVLPIEEASDDNANMPGGPLKLTIRVQFVENVTLNQGPRGTGLPCRIWTACAEKLLKLYTPVGLTQNLVPATPTISEFTPDLDSNLRVGQVTFTAMEADFRLFNKVNRPQISVAAATVSPASPNSYLLAGPAMATVTAPGADTIFYTTDGSHPFEGNAQAQPYTVPVQIVGPGLFRVRAFAAGKAGSDTAAANFYQT